MEYVSQALNERQALYGTKSLRKRLTDDGRNTAVLDAFAFALSLDQAPYAVYEVLSAAVVLRGPYGRLSPVARQGVPVAAVVVP
ncbi:hypothetical protein GCM10023080_029830 [Streptomyces pseudoechinosporeus]